MNDGWVHLVQFQVPATVHVGSLSRCHVVLVEKIEVIIIVVQNTFKVKLWQIKNVCGKKKGLYMKYHISANVNQFG